VSEIEIENTVKEKENSASFMNRHVEHKNVAVLIFVRQQAIRTSLLLAGRLFAVSSQRRPWRAIVSHTSPCIVVNSADVSSRISQTHSAAEIKYASLQVLHDNGELISRTSSQNLKKIRASRDYQISKFEFVIEGNNGPILFVQFLPFLRID